MQIPAIRVRQWLEAWDDYQYDEGARQTKPHPHFYICSIPAAVLRRLAGVQQREAEGPRVDDIGIQRGHDPNRSKQIRRFVQAGYPWATLSNRDQQRFLELRKPGWLPTAVVANLVRSTTKRGDNYCEPSDLVTIEEDPTDGNRHYLVLPEGAEDMGWKSTAGRLDPLEIIDGQHRLYAFSEDDEEGSFELPVVIFDDLDISWQAYLFWSINITPKRINPSMAYDLYPLLRTSDWLEFVEGPMAYRETRAQELTEALWSHPQSPWFQRIGMLGRERGKVTQAAFVRSLTLSFVRGWSSRNRTGIGGFFGTEKSNTRADVLRWTRAQQAAYLISLFTALRDSIAESTHSWAENLRSISASEDETADTDPAFTGRYSMLSTDQGVRGFLQVCNDISFDARNEVPFQGWQRPVSAEATDIDEVSKALKELEAQSEITRFISGLANIVSGFDWRSGVTPGLTPEEEAFQSRYRSGSGYKQVRLQLLRHLSESGRSTIASSASSVAKDLGYDQEWH